MRDGWGDAVIVELNPSKWFHKLQGASAENAASALGQVEAAPIVAAESKPAEAEESEMSVATVLQAVDNDVKGFFGKLVADFNKAKAVWSAISNPQTRALLMKIGADAIKLGKDADAAATAAGLSLALDLQTVADIKQLVADAKAGDGVIVADLKLIGINL